MPKKKIPSYRLHKPSGRAVVTINRKDIPLGKYNSKESWKKYQKVIAEYLDNDSKLPPTRTQKEITVKELATKFLEWAEGYYVQNGQQTSSFDICKLAMGPLVHHYGENGVGKFGPQSLIFLQDKWIKAGAKRETINKFCTTIKKCFRHGVKLELVETEVWQALTAVDNLKAGRTTAEEYRKVETVADDIVDATLPFLRSVVRDMVQVQRLAGFRPQDVRNLRACDIDRSGDVWVYRPFTHKNKHKDKDRVLAIGPRAQAILTPYLVEKADDPEAFLFSPKDTVKLQNVEKRQNRKTLNKRGTVQPSQVDRSKANPKKKPKDQYDKNSYNRAIKRACIKVGVPSWTPNQLRHTAATEIRKAYGLEAAQVILGHENADVTQIYAERNFELAAKVAREIG